MNAHIKIEERKELIDIYNNLSPSLKKQLLMTARIIETTQNITLADKWKKKKSKNI